MMMPNKMASPAVGMQQQRRAAPKQQQKKVRPIFSIAKFPNPSELPTSKRKDVVIGGKTIVVATDTSIVRWTKTDQGGDVFDDIELPASRGAIHKVFIDHTGHHIIVSMVDGENYYVHNSAKKLFFLKNMNNEVVNTVLWDTIDGTPNFTKNILLGTTSGRIFETALERSTKSFKFIKRTEVTNEIVHLHCELLSNAPGVPRRMCIMATTVKGQAFQFIGGPDYAAIFEKYAESRVPDHRIKVHKYMPDCPIRFTGRKGGPSTGFAVLTDTHVVSGDVNFSQSAEASVLVNRQRLDISRTQSPRGLVVTEFHFVVLDDTGLSVINRVSKKPAFFFPNAAFGGRVIRLLQHPMMELILVCTADRFFRVLKSPNEGRDMWKDYLDLALGGDASKFALARKYCTTQEHADKVDLSEAEYYFEKQDYSQSAKKYAHTKKSFEDIVLRFLDVNDNVPLTDYLLEKLYSLDNGKTSQKTILCTWIVEIYLNRINALEDAPEGDSTAGPLLNRTKRHFRTFVKKNKEFLSRENKETIIKLLSSHG